MQVNHLVSLPLSQLFLAPNFFLSWSYLAMLRSCAPGEAWRTVWDAGDGIQVRCVQSKRPTGYVITTAPSCYILGVSSIFDYLPFFFIFRPHLALLRNHMGCQESNLGHVCARPACYAMYHLSRPLYIFGGGGGGKLMVQYDGAQNSLPAMLVGLY